MDGGTVERAHVMPLLEVSTSAPFGSASPTAANSGEPEGRWPNVTPRMLFVVGGGWCFQEMPLEDVNKSPSLPTATYVPAPRVMLRKFKSLPALRAVQFNP